MRRPLRVLACLFSALSVCCACLAADEPSVPEGMELVKVGGTNVLLPAGTKVTRKDALLILEPLDEYASRRLKSLEEQVAALTAEVAAMEHELADLRGRLAAAERQRR